MAKQRLDVLLVERGLFESREKAKRAVMAGLVEVDGQRSGKAGAPVAADAELSVRAREPFVSRAGRKLAHALDTFELSCEGLVCLDVGASTGGFVDCLLQRGASKVFAVDVGYGQLDASLRNHPQVVVMERTNARHLPADALGEPCALVTIDVSFISLVKIVPALLPHLADGGFMLPMIKPQFEAGRELVGKGGIVRDESVRQQVITECVADLCDLGLAVRGVIDNELTGMGGNREAFALMRKAAGGLM